MSARPPIDAISPLLAPLQMDMPSAAPPSAPDAGGSRFGNLVSEGLAQLNGQLVDSQVELQKLALGDTQSLHHTMIRLEEARVSFQLMMQVRSRLLEAYQDLMKMPL